VTSNIAFFTDVIRTVCEKVANSTAFVYGPCIRVLYTAVYKPLVTVLYGPCTRLCTVYTAVYTGRVHGRVHVYTTVTNVYMASGRVCIRPVCTACMYTARIHGRVCIRPVYTAVYTAMYMAVYTARTHGRVHGPYTAVYVP